MKKVYVLMGGLVGWDGPLTSCGLYPLAREIAKLPDTEVKTYLWSSWPSVMEDIRKQPAGDKSIIVGFSGGGSRATWIAHRPGLSVDLIIGYDPSPKWQIEPFGHNVKKAICYYNRMPLMLGLGGGRFSGPQVETVEVAKQHLLVQFDQSLHARTLKAISEL